MTDRPDGSRHAISGKVPVVNDEMRAMRDRLLEHPAVQRMATHPAVQRATELAQSPAAQKVLQHPATQRVAEVASHPAVRRVLSSRAGRRIAFALGVFALRRAWGLVKRPWVWIAAAVGWAIFRLGQREADLA